MKTISALAKSFGLSRSTLIYYDRLGLLQPDARSPANYRLYSETAIARLSFITTLRETGLSLENIKTILSSNSASFQHLLEQRLSQLNGEIADLRQQQQVIIKLLQDEQLLSDSRVMDKTRWIELLRASGMDERQMQQWHQQFEAMSPQAHQDFLESLGIDKKEIKTIRKRSAVADRTPH